MELKNTDQGAMAPICRRHAMMTSWKGGSVFWLCRNGRTLSLRQQPCTPGMTYHLLCCCQDTTVSLIFRIHLWIVKGKSFSYIGKVPEVECIQQKYLLQ